MADPHSPPFAPLLELQASLLNKQTVSQDVLEAILSQTLELIERGESKTFPVPVLRALEDVLKHCISSSHYMSIPNCSAVVVKLFVFLSRAAPSTAEDEEQEIAAVAEMLSYCANGKHLQTAGPDSELGHNPVLNLPVIRYANALGVSECDLLQQEKRTLCDFIECLADLKRKMRLPSPSRYAETKRFLTAFASGMPVDVESLGSVTSLLLLVEVSKGVDGLPPDVLCQILLRIFRSDESDPRGFCKAMLRCPWILRKICRGLLKRFVRKCRGNESGVVMVDSVVECVGTILRGSPDVESLVRCFLYRIWRNSGFSGLVLELWRALSRDLVRGRDVFGLWEDIVEQRDRVLAWWMFQGNVEEIVLRSFNVLRENLGLQQGDKTRVAEVVVFLSSQSPKTGFVRSPTCLCPVVASEFLVDEFLPSVADWTPATQRALESEILSSRLRLLGALWSVCTSRNLTPTALVETNRLIRSMALDSSVLRKLHVDSALLAFRRLNTGESIDKALEFLLRRGEESEIPKILDETDLTMDQAD